MRQLAAGVSVVTASTESDRSGFTATSVISLLVEPPRLLVSINQRSSTLELIRRSGRFSVSFLASDQQHIAESFAQKRAGRRAAFRVGEVAGGSGHGPFAERGSGQFGMRGGRDDRAARSCAYDRSRRLVGYAEPSAVGALKPNIRTTDRSCLAQTRPEYAEPGMHVVPVASLASRLLSAPIRSLRPPLRFPESGHCCSRRVTTG